MCVTAGDALWEDGGLPCPEMGKQDGGEFGQTADVHRQNRPPKINAYT